MRRIGAFGGSTALWALLAAHVAGAFEPVSVGIAIGAVSALTGYLSYPSSSARSPEGCQAYRPPNPSGLAPGAGRGGRVGTGSLAPAPAGCGAAGDTHGRDLATPLQALQ